MHNYFIFLRVLYVVSTVGMVTLIIVLVALDKPKNLWSLAGLAALIIICFVTSYNPGMVRNQSWPSRGRISSLSVIDRDIFNSLVLIVMC